MSEPRTSVEPGAGIVRRWLWKAERVHYAGTTREMREQIVGLSFTEGRAERAAERASRRLTPPADEADYVEQYMAAVERDAGRER